MDKAIFETAHLAALNDQQRAAVEAVNGPVLLLCADDDRLVDEGTCNRYAQVYTAPDVDTIAGGGHNFATLAARAAVEEKTAAFIKANL